LFDHVQIQLDLSRLFGGRVDLISRRGLEQSHNWLLREEILGTAQVVFTSSEAARAAGG
jgi:predicted nucleotidyltransferase